MDNDRVNPSRNDDEEYQFTEDDGASKYGSSATVSSSSVLESQDKESSRRKKLILIIIGVIVGAFCLYKLYGLFTVAPPKPNTTLTASTAQAKTVLPPATAPVVQKSEPITPLQPVLSEEKFDREDLKNKISTLEQTVIQNGRTQENLQAQIGGISSAITEIQDNIAMLTQQVNTIAQQKSESELKLKEEKAEAARKAEEAKKSVKKYSYRHKPKVSYAPYYVKAMIQGRAWLINTQGATLTISAGDQLLGYGQIQEIDPDKGIVTTSSGRIISYMSHDR